MADTTVSVGDSITQQIHQVKLKDNGDGTFSVGTTATLAGDIEIGAVEIKNATDDTRATVGANGLHVDVRSLPAGGATDAVLTGGAQKTQFVDPDGTVASVGLRAQAPTKNNALQVQIGPGDVISSLPITMDYPHHQIHEGETWEWFFFGAVNATTKDIRISVANVAATTRTPHLLPEVVADNTTTQIFFYEGTTWTAAGTDDSARIYNRNRNIGGAPSTKIYVTGATALTVNALGTQLYQGYLFTGKASANAERNLAEWVLKTSTEYLFRVTTTGNGNVLIRLHWYEDLGV